MAKEYQIDIPIWGTVRVQANSEKEATRMIFGEMKCVEVGVSSSEVPDNMELSPVGTVACDIEEWIGLRARLSD